MADNETNAEPGWRINEEEEIKSMRFRISCIETNQRHTKFTLYDPHGANCGVITILTDDVRLFLQRSWNGDIFWHDHIPQSLERTNEL